jgi:peptide/nickel transport system substrate-binding protein
VVLLAVSGACGGDRAAARGTLVIATGGDPDALFPPVVATLQGQQVVDLMFDRLAEIGDDLTVLGDVGFTPRLATGWRWAADSASVTFTLDSAARWHDGRPVRGADVVAALALIRDPRVASPAVSDLADVDSVTAAGDREATVWFGTTAPTRFYSLTRFLVPVPSHLLDGVRRDSLRASSLARAPVGNGPFRFVRWQPRERIELAADTTHPRGRPGLDRVIFSIAADAAAITAKMVAGEADLLENVAPADVARLRGVRDLRLRPYATLEYGFLGFNLRDPSDTTRPHPVLGDVAVRHAITRAIDRDRAVRAVFDSLAWPALGPVVRAQFTADTTLDPLGHDPAAARASLEAAGWQDRDGDGVRERDGRALTFTVLVPSTSLPRQRLATLLQDDLRAVGVRMETATLEGAVIGPRLGARDFDAWLGAWTTNPSPGSVRQTWGSPGGRPGAQNFGMYVSAAFTAHVDSGLATADATAARAHFRAAYATIRDDAPAVWLYEPRRLMAVHARIRIPSLRRDKWWVTIPTWSVDPGARLPRDGTAR